MYSIETQWTARQLLAIENLLHNVTESPAEFIEDTIEKYLDGEIDSAVECDCCSRTATEHHCTEHLATALANYHTEQTPRGESDAQERIAVLEAEAKILITERNMLRGQLETLTDLKNNPPTRKRAVKK
jgi:hypothetical protein